MQKVLCAHVCRCSRRCRPSRFAAKLGEPLALVEEASRLVEASGEADGNPSVTLTFGANPAARIGRILAARLPFGRGLLIDSPDGAVVFLRASTSPWRRKIG